MVELYLPMFLMFGVAGLICAGMFLGAAWVGPKHPTPEKLMPYECGNDTEGARGVRLDVKFYLTAILFVVFDVEVVFIYPWAALFRQIGWPGLVTMFVFIAALLVALGYCWKKGALEWER
jgi:NADH-quinone oxidoreductase subunit A